MLIGLNFDAKLYFTTRSLFFFLFQVLLQIQLAGVIPVSHTQVSSKTCGQTLSMSLKETYLLEEKKNHKNMKYVTVCNIYIAMVYFSATLTNWGIVCSMVLMSGAKRHFPSNPRLIRDRTLYNALSYLVTWER